MTASAAWRFAAKPARTALRAARAASKSSRRANFLRSASSSVSLAARPRMLFRRFSTPRSWAFAAASTSAGVVSVVACGVSAAAAAAAARRRRRRRCAAPPSSARCRRTPPRFEARSRWRRRPRGTSPRRFLQLGPPLGEFGARYVNQRSKAATHESLFGRVVIVIDCDFDLRSTMMVDAS